MLTKSDCTETRGASECTSGEEKMAEDRLGGGTRNGGDSVLGEMVGVV